MNCPHCAREIPESAVRSEIGRLSSLARKKHSGGISPGRPITCECGSCPKCIRRRKRAERRKAAHL